MSECNKALRKLTAARAAADMARYDDAWHAERAALQAVAQESEPDALAKAATGWLAARETVQRAVDDAYFHNQIGLAAQQATAEALAGKAGVAVNWMVLPERT